MYIPPDAPPHLPTAVWCQQCDDLAKSEFDSLAAPLILILFGTSVSDNPPFPPWVVIPSLSVFSFDFEIMLPVLLSASFAQGLRWPHLRTCYHQFNIYTNYATIDGGLSIGPGGHFLETPTRYRASGNN